MNIRLPKLMLLCAVMLLVVSPGMVLTAAAQVPAPGPQPTYAISTALSLTQGTNAAVNADFNLDGFMDLATVEPATGNVSIWLGSNAGFVTGPVSILSVSSNSLAQPVGLAVGDFNKDGKPDLVVANKQDNSASVFRNTTASPGAAPIFVATRIPIQSTATLIGLLTDNATSTNELCPTLRNKFARAVYLIKAPELAARGLVAGSVIKGIGWNYTTGNNLSGSGALVVYLQNTADIANSKNTTFATAISGMTTVHNATTPLPSGAGSFDIAFSGSGISTFTYTGGALYVAFEIAYAGTPSTTTTVLCNGTGLTGGLLGAQSAATAPTTLSPVPLRPETRFTATMPGSQPAAIAAADVDFDGNLDFATANYLSNSMTVFFGNGASGADLSFPRSRNYPLTVGAGQFGAKTDITVGDSPRSIGMADVNRDGRLDVLAANTNSSSVSVRLGDGSGGFTSAPDVLVGASPFSLATADFNADGKPDFAVANLGANTISVRLGNGGGGFTAATDVPTGLTPFSLAIGDLNGDNKLDMVVANRDGNTVSILLGDGSGGFTAATPATVATGPFPRSVAIGDVNGDGKPDLAVANRDDNTVSILIGSGSGTFAPANPATVSTGTKPRVVALGDVNRDGNLDLVVTNEINGSVSVMLGDGHGAFSARTSYPTGVNPQQVVIGDINADGKPDLLVAATVSNTITVLIGDGNGAFSRTPSAFTGLGPSEVALGDLNGDGRPDMAVANYGPCCGLSSSISVMLGNGAGVFPGTNPNSIVFTDLNRDGHPDALLGANNGSLLFVLDNTATASGSSDPYAMTGQFPNPMSYEVGANPVAASAADMNGDLSPDVVVSDNGGVSGTAVVSVLFGNGDGFLGTAPCTSGCGPGKRLDISGVGNSPQGVVVGDLNGDSYNDIAVVDDSHGAADGVAMFLGNGLGCFGTPASCGSWGVVSPPLVPGILPKGIGLGDLNNDGQPDLYVSNTVAPGLTLFGNNQGGAKACAVIPTTTPPIPPICITSRTPCVGIPVTISGTLASRSLSPSVRGYSATLRLSSNLTLCPQTGLPGTAFAKGDYLTTGGRTTSLNVASNPDGSFTIDEAILSTLASACGPSTSPIPATNNQLFTVFVASSTPFVPAPLVTGTISITGLTLRDCKNDPLTAFACPTASQGRIKIKTADPLPANLLVERQKRTSNTAGQTTEIDLQWTPPPNDVNSPAATTKFDVWRAPFTGTISNVNLSGYPDYAGTDPSASPPTSLTLYPINAAPLSTSGPWVKLLTGVAGGTSTISDVDFPVVRLAPPVLKQRGFWYYMVFRVDECGTPSLALGPRFDASNVKVDVLADVGLPSQFWDFGTLNYHLGDVTNSSVVLCEGDNFVTSLADYRNGIRDSYLGNLAITHPGANACLDYAPTIVGGGGNQHRRPKPDGRCSAEEVILLQTNLNRVSAPQLAAQPAAADHDEVLLEAPTVVAAGERFSAKLRLSGAGDLRAIMASLGWNAAVVEPLSVNEGDMVTRQDGIVVSNAPGELLAVLSGPDRPGFLGEGTLATVEFQAKASGDPGVMIKSLEARNMSNLRQNITGAAQPPPKSTALAPVTPNPFQRRATLGFTLVSSGRAELAIYSVDGRRVKTLAGGTRAAGAYRFDWDGTDEAGRNVPPGVFFARLLTEQGKFNRTVVMVR